jgi:hypothetical protein
MTLNMCTKAKKMSRLALQLWMERRVSSPLHSPASYVCFGKLRLLRPWHADCPSCRATWVNLHT